jgi:hypothetical protein
MINELDDLKNAWKTISETESKKDYSVQELEKIVRKKSNNELAKIRRKILLEWGVGILLSVFLVLFIRIVNPSDAKFALLFIGVILLVSFFPYISIFQLKFSSHTDLLSYLREFIFRFQNLVKQYIRMSAILVPIAGIGGFLLGLHSTTNNDEWFDFFTLSNLLLLAFFILLISFGGYWLQGRYFKWVYGKNIQRLKVCLEELEEVEEKEE